MLGMPSPWILLAGVLALLAAATGGYAEGKHTANTEWTAKTETARSDAEAKARTQETMWQGVVNETVKNFQADVDRVGRDRDAALRSLRNRPERPDSLPEAPRSKRQCGIS